MAGSGERGRVSAIALQLGLHSFGFGAAVDQADTWLLRDAAANTLALRNGPTAQTGSTPSTFRIYETYSSSGDYARLSFTTQPERANSNHRIRTEAAGAKTLRPLQLGFAEKAGTMNGSGVDTIIHAGQGTGSAAGGSILFQARPGGAVDLQTVWQIDRTGHLLANDTGKMIRWGAFSNFPALKSSDTIGFSW